MEGYKQKLKKKFGLEVSPQFISRWFKEIGPFKGTMRKTSTFPPNRNSPEVVARLEAYLEFMDSLPSHKNIVFADEKPLKEVDCYGKVRRDPMTGIVNANHCVNANSRNRWNIFAAINVKKDADDNCLALVLEEKGDSNFFHDYVELLIMEGFLETGDIFEVQTGLPSAYSLSKEETAKFYSRTISNFFETPLFSLSKF